MMLSEQGKLKCKDENLPTRYVPTLSTIVLRVALGVGNIEDVIIMNAWVWCNDCPFTVSIQLIKDSKQRDKSILLTSLIEQGKLSIYFVESSLSTN